MPQPPSDPLPEGWPSADARSLAALYASLGTRLYRTALSMLNSPDDAEDAVQQLFAGLVRSKNRLADAVDAEAYLFASLRRVVLRQLAERRKNAYQSDLGDAAGPAVPSGHYGGWDGEDLAGALARLPAEQREVIALKIDAALTFAQIGAMLQISPNTAASRYRYALEKLRAAMEGKR